MTVLPCGPAVEATLAPEVQTALARLRELCRERFADRAARYDREAAFPHEDFDDLLAARLNAPAVPERFGGLGLGPQRGRALGLWLMTKELARANLALARCWEGHANALVLLDALAVDEQRERWFVGIVERGDKWAVWSGEPQKRIPGQTATIGTRVEEVDGGWVVDGTKVFASNAGAAQWAIVLVSTAGAGGARHTSGPSDELLALVCDLSDPSVSFDGSWWDPVGMRATASYLARFDRTFIPRANLIGAPGQFLRDDWQARFTPQYAASFLGAAEAAATYATEHIRVSKRRDDPYVQHRIARMSVQLDTSLLWLQHTAGLWARGEVHAAKNAGSRARWLVEQAAEAVLHDAVHVCGARALNGRTALERTLRDLTFYMRHDNDDHILSTIGRAVIGFDHDLSFHR